MTAPLATFVTRSISARGGRWMMIYLFGSIGLLILALAWVNAETWVELLVTALAVLPVGGFVLLSLLLMQHNEIAITDTGLEIKSSPAYRLSLTKETRAMYVWTDVKDYIEDDQFLLGHYGMLEIGLHCPPYSVQIMPVRREEEAAFDVFVEAFRKEVALLNLDDTPRAVAVAQIRHRHSFFDLPAAKVLTIVLTLLLLGLPFTQLGVFKLTEEARTDALWQMAYLYMLLIPLTAYCWRRSFGRKSVGRRE